MGVKMLHLKCDNPVLRRRKQQTYFQLYEKIFFHFGLFLSIQILEPVYCFLLMIEAASTGLQLSPSVLKCEQREYAIREGGAAGSKVKVEAISSEYMTRC